MPLRRFVQIIFRHKRGERVLRKLAAWLAVLLAVCACAGAEAPVLVDRINTPQEYADFTFADDAPLLEMYFAPVFDADAALLRCGGQTIMIDCGSKVMTKRTIGMLKQLGVTEIDAIINTHPHYDHLQGLEQIAQVVKVKELRLCFPLTENEQAQLTADYCAANDIPITYFEDGAQWKLGEATLDVWLKGDEDWDLNDRSAVIRVQYGDRTALFTADAGHMAQQRLAEIIPAELLDADVLKYPHHGIQPLQETFRDAVSPALAVITNKDYERMTTTKQRLRQNKIPFAFTLKGPVAVCTDGHTWLAERLPIDPTTIN